MTMKRDLLSLLQTQWVSPMEALQQADCFSLSQRVSEWRRAGVQIDDEWLVLPNGKRVKRYRVSQ